MSIQSATMPFPVRLKSSVKLDPQLMTLSLALLFCGFVVLASASISVSDRIAGQPFYYVQRQLVAAIIGAGAAAVCLFVPMNFWRNIGPVMLLFGLAILVIVLLPGFGHTVNGATRWVRVGIMNFQVSEPARLCAIIYIAGYLVRQNRSLRDGFLGFFRPMLVLVVFCALLLAEPDYGAATVLTTTVLAMLFVAGARFRDFFLFLGLAVIALSALAITSPYRMQRLTAFLDPWADPFNSGFQLTQSLIAIGRGEWFGVGLGEGVQKLFYLPEAHTDFVFAVLAEEFGLVGGVAVIALFLAFLWRIFSIAMRAASSDRLFEAYLGIGIGTWIGLQAFINIGVNMGLLPTKGLTLPLISYGRSSLIVMMMCIGLLLRINHELTTDAAPSNNKSSRKSTRKSRPRSRR